jgi:hypothetical protein
VSRPLRVVRALVVRLALDEELGPVAPHVPLVLALGVHFVKGAVRTLVVKRRVAQLRVVPRLEVLLPLRASACFPQLRLLAPQRSAPVQRPYQERPWSLAR